MMAVCQKFAALFASLGGTKRRFRWHLNLVEVAPELSPTAAPLRSLMQNYEKGGMLAIYLPKNSRKNILD